MNVRCLAFRPDHRNTRKGFVDIEVAPLVIRGCVWHESHGKEWLAFPASPSAAGGWTPHVVFAEGADREEFQREAIDAIYRHLGGSSERGGDLLPLLMP